ncbi:ribonuclease III [Patescibacteria group bacterium]|nr:ribonuclease III [Patescibacteria group bacterium]MCL5010337.1 ribonuclease III [Patescibacteria group bacterium]
MKNLPNFKNKKLFDQAFTHRSYLNEAREKLENNERLEFLGDSIISFIVSRHLFALFPNFNEGKLTNLRSLLVNTKSLASVARQLNFGSLLKLSRGEEESNGRENESLLADSFEAFVGALYLDRGIETVETFLRSVLLEKTSVLARENTLKDPKSLLQEFVQAKKQNAPVYKVLAEEGPAHERLFTVGVYVQNALIEQGKGKSKQRAEEEAAEKALRKLNKA